MKTYSISELGRAGGLSRSTLLYYDRIGLLRPSGRSGAGYRRYDQECLRRLERIREFRAAGLTLGEIRAVLRSGRKPEAHLLERRLREAAAGIVNLKRQQRLLGGMLRQVAAGGRPAAVDKKLWVQMLRAAGLSESGMIRWHAEFEQHAPEGHEEFLLSLGIPADEVSRIRAWSRGETAPG